MAHPYTYTGASVFYTGRRQKFCESAARLDGLANLRFGDRTTEPEIKRYGPTRVCVLMHICISHMWPLSKIINAYHLSFQCFRISDGADTCFWLPYLLSGSRGWDTMKLNNNKKNPARKKSGRSIKLHAELQKWNKHVLQGYRDA